MRNDLDKKTIYFETEPLSKNMEVTGHPIVHLALSSTADYGDVFVYLNDVDRTGNSLLVTEGQLRAGFAKLYDSDEMIKTHSGIDVKPDLPRHGYNKDQYADKVFAGGKLVNLTIDLHPTSWIFKKGHKIRLSIACSDHPHSGCTRNWLQEMIRKILIILCRRSLCFSATGIIHFSNCQ